MRALKNDSILPSGMTIRGSIDPVVYAEARKWLAKALWRPWVDTAPFAARRYTFKLLSEGDIEGMARSMRKKGKLDCLYGQCRFMWEVVAKGGRTSKLKVGPKKYQREVLAKTFRYPKLEVIEEVPDDPDLVFRGMSFEEFQEMQQSGYIRSRGWYNLGKQSNLTFFADAQSAQHYASGFTPWQFKPGYEYPGIVIGVDKKKTKTRIKDRIVPEGERAIRGRIPISDIEQVWAIVPIEIEHAKMEVISDERKGTADIYGGQPSVYSCVAQLR